MLSCVNKLSKIDDHYDIVVVGAGVVGASFLLALASLPLKIALLEAKTIQPSQLSGHDNRAIALNYQSVKFLQELGLWQTLESHATPILSVHISDRGHFGFTRIRAQDQQVPALGYVVPAAILGGILNQALCTCLQNTQTTLKVFSPAQLQTLQSQTTGWELTFDTSGTKQTITADLVVAADGTRSTVRQLLALKTHTKDYQQTALVTTVTLVDSHHFVAYERFLDQGAIALLPLAENRSCCIWTAANDQIKNLQSLSHDQLLAAIQKTFGYRLGRFTHMSEYITYPLSAVYAEESVRPGLVLIGNAAQTLHPIAAQGFNVGLKDVALLTTLLRGAITTRNKIGDMALLKKYQTQRQADVAWIMKFTDNLPRFFGSDFLPLVLARNTAMLALDFIPALKRRIAQRLMGVWS